MGQNYKPCILGEQPQENESEKLVAFVYSWDYGCWLKLMVHSWLPNPFVNAFESLISPVGAYHKSRVVWAGDYADAELNTPKCNLYDYCEDELNKLTPKHNSMKKYNYVVNHTKQMFVDKRKVVDSDGWKIHPLPLLTCEGNGEGGGDFYGKDNKNLIGSWARDVISVESKKPKGYTELMFDLVED